MRNEKGQFLSGNKPWFKEKGLRSPTNGVAWNRGIESSKETRKKISLVRKENWKNKKYKENMSKKHTGKTKEQASNWKGGSLKWRKQQALIRDNYSCQICGLREPEIMQIDHIKPKCVFPELELEMNNLMTLCPNCHAKKTIREKKVRYSRSFFDNTNGFIQIA